ncbi:MAG: invasion associated locus B family protein [Pseudomonadota bacterium]|nr:invasion associated locus B family protein [Pseudomonadota bacterium]
MIRNLAHLSVLALSLCAASGAVAEEMEKLGAFNAWEAYAYTSPNQGKVCYAMARPKTSEPEGVNRDDIFFIITNRPKQGQRNEVSTVVGYSFKKESRAQLIVGAKTYELFAVGDTAWSRDKEHDKEIIGSLKKGADMSLKGQSWRGTATTDHYSLEGVSAAVDKIDEACKE